MLCRAMASVSWPMTIASATRERSSARTTTSAASAEMPPPWLASATPTCAAESAGASFVPSPTIITRAPSRPS